jgi:Protein of unknown function (DUF3105)
VADTKVRQSAPSGGSRREKLASLEAARKKEQRRRSLTLLLICIVLAGALLAYPVYLAASDYIARNATLDDLGNSMSAAGCDPIAEETATGNQEHVAEGTKVTYERFPPDSGQHYPSPAPFTKRFYTTEDRPPVEELVHNLEHGYTIAWYRSDLSGKQLKALQNIAKTFSKDDQNPANKFIAAPWNDATDGGAMPAGKNMVITHWYADPNEPGNATTQKGVRQACAAVSGPAIKEFMAKYPHANSPEPSGA